MNTTTNSENAQQESLFMRLGGAPAIALVVANLYERVRADPELGGYFHTTDMDVQRRKLSEMLTDVLGGPSAPWLLDLRSAHRGRGIQHRHFSLALRSPHRCADRCRRACRRSRRRDRVGLQRPLRRRRRVSSRRLNQHRDN